MSSPVAPVTEASIESAALGRLTAAATTPAASTTPTPTPEAPATPVPAAPVTEIPAVPAPATPETPAPAAPVEATPQAPTPTPDPAAPAPGTTPPPIEDPGEQINRLIAERLQKLGKTSDAPVPPPVPVGTQPETPAPAPPPPVQAPPPTPPAVVDPAVAINEKVVEYVRADPACTELINQWKGADSSLKLVQEQIKAQVPSGNLEFEIGFLNRQLQTPDLDPVTSRELRDKLHLLTSLENRVESLENRKATLNLQFVSREEAIKRGVWEQYTQHQRQQQQQAEVEARAQRYQQELIQAWPVAVQAVAQVRNIPQALIPKLDLRAQEAAIAQLTRGLPVQDVGAFVDRIAQDLLADLDLYHRTQSGIHAQKAHQLQQQTSSAQVIPSSQSPPAAESVRPSNNPLADIDRAAEMRLRELMR